MFSRAIAAFAVAISLSAPAIAEIGRVKRVVGEAWIERGGRRLPPAPGFALLESDTLATGRNGRISITFIDNTRFSAGPSSRVALEQFRFDETTRRGTFVTRVNRGSLAVVSGQIAHENRDAMRVRTPTSVLGVRGTRFVVTVQ